MLYNLVGGKMDEIGYLSVGEEEKSSQVPRPLVQVSWGTWRGKEHLLEIKQKENLVDDHHGGSENKRQQILPTNATMGRWLLRFEFTLVLELKKTPPWKHFWLW